MPDRLSLNTSSELPRFVTSRVYLTSLSSGTDMLRNAWSVSPASTSQ